MKSKSPKYAEKRAEYQQSAKGKEVRAKYLQRPEVKRANCLQSINKNNLKRADEACLDAQELAAINEFYYEALRLTNLTGVAHDVDHILPIALGGSHSAYNLQVLTASENRSKGCKFREEDRALYTQRVAHLFHGS